MNTAQSQKQWHDVHRPSLQNTRYRYSGVWMSFVWSTHHSLLGAACCNPILVSLPVNYQGLLPTGQVDDCGFFPNYFIGPLVCWSHAGLIVPLKGPSKCLMARPHGRLVGIAKILRMQSQIPSTWYMYSLKPQYKTQYFYTVGIYRVYFVEYRVGRYFGILARSIAARLAMISLPYAEPWLLWWWRHSPSQNTAIIPNTAVFWWRYTDCPKNLIPPKLISNI